MDTVYFDSNRTRCVRSDSFYRKAVRQFIGSETKFRHERGKIWKVVNDHIDDNIVNDIHGDAHVSGPNNYGGKSFGYFIAFNLLFVTIAFLP